MLSKIYKKWKELFVRDGVYEVNLSKDDVIKFYELRNHQDDISTNIGVIGDSKNFKIKMREILKVSGLKQKRTDDVFICDNGDKVTIIIGDIENSYIKIETLHDLVGRKFRKYI